MRISYLFITFASLLFCLAPLSEALAASPSDWYEGTPGKDDGATRDYYNRDARLDVTLLVKLWKRKEHRNLGMLI